MIRVNFWMVVSNAFRDELTSVLSRGFQAGTAAVQFPKLNNPPRAFIDGSRGAYSLGKVSHSEDPNTTIWSGNISSDHLGELTPLREFLQDLELRYFPDFYVGGMWDMVTGQPIGGVGSPWFQTPSELAAVMGGSVSDVELAFGQAKRIFI
jgi:hypothetical protein